jgi:hypothetical protein
MMAASIYLRVAAVAVLFWVWKTADKKVIALFSGCSVAYT